MVSSALQARAMEEAQLVRAAGAPSSRRSPASAHPLLTVLEPEAAAVYCQHRMAAELAQVVRAARCRRRRCCICCVILFCLQKHHNKQQL